MSLQAGKIMSLQNIWRECCCNRTLFNHIFYLISIWMMALLKTAQMRNLVENRGW